MHLGACIMVEDDAAHVELAELPIGLRRREDRWLKKKKKVDLFGKTKNWLKLATRFGAPGRDHGDRSRRGRRGRSCGG
jgi:hypothetical protein